MTKRCCANSCYNSITINNSVNYFAFPHQMDYCRQWLKAAGRLDLLDKDLKKLVKYHLCSDHFTDDCFLDPETKTRLKKNLRPVRVPIPTIFKCNFQKLIPKNISYNGPLRKGLSKAKENIILLTDDEDEEGEEVGDESIICVDFAEDPIEVAAVDEPETSTCRLCCSNLPTEELIDLFSDQSLLDQWQTVLPNEIIDVEDDLPHSICQQCEEDLKTASRITSKFQNSQIVLRNV